MWTMRNTSHTRNWRLVPLLVLMLPAYCAAQTDEEVNAATPAPASATPEALNVSEPQIKPRLELHIPSTGKLTTEANRSHSGVFLRSLGRVVSEMASRSAEGVDADEALAVVGQVADWPDASVSAFIYAPDTEGRLQWAIRINWPLEELHRRFLKSLESSATSELFEGLSVQGNGKSGFKFTLRDSTLAYLMPMGESHSCVSSHTELPIPQETRTGVSEPVSEDTPLIICKLNFVGTEKDSGATFLSSFSAVTGIEYTGRVDAEGSWTESVQVHWPPISGMGAKALFGKVKQTFFVPDSAFGAIVMKVLIGPGMLDSMAGFGQQVMMDPSGEMTIMGEAEIGPITSFAEPELCVVLLPGTGFLPVPDIIVQARTKRPERLVDGIRDAAEKHNEVCRNREWSEPWHEVTVRDRAVFWSEGSQQYPGVMMPLIMRPVLFVAKEVDARDRERDFLVLGWTSTSPEALVRRWLDSPRSNDRRYLPVKRKTNGQVWLNWKQFYKWVSPYINVPLGALATTVPLPAPDEVASEMTDAMITVKLSYAGLKLSHTGPLPTGALFVPILIGVSTSADDAGDSDLARERLACHRLKVLYHHASLFKQDIGRWPAEVVELDGYVDFEGHPELLKLQLSPRKQWSKWLEAFTEREEQDDESEVDEEESEIDDDLYVIEWGRDTWRLKLAPDTLEHLEELYIDQDGKIHRREKIKKEEKDEISKGETKGDGLTTASVLEQAAQSVASRYVRP